VQQYGPIRQVKYPVIFSRANGPDNSHHQPQQP